MTVFKRCRLCLVPENDAALSSLRENDGGKALLFEKLFGINVSSVLVGNAATINILQF